MPKIATVNSDVFQLGVGMYPKGNYVPKYRTQNGKLHVRIKSSDNTDYIEDSSQYKAWDTFTDSNDAAFASETAFATALANILAKSEGLDTVANDKGTVSQAASVSTAVTLNNLNGIISTFAQTLAADGTAVTFTVNNSKVTANSNVILTPIYPVGNTGTPVVSVSSIAGGSFVVEINNAGTAALNGANGTLKIGFIVLP